MKKFLAMLLALVMVLSMAACAAPAENKTDDKAAQDDFQSQILFCGSTSLYPIISSLASSLMAPKPKKPFCWLSAAMSACRTTIWLKMPARSAARFCFSCS